MTGRPAFSTSLTASLILGWCTLQSGMLTTSWVPRRNSPIRSPFFRNGRTASLARQRQAPGEASVTRKGSPGLLLSKNSSAASGWSQVKSGAVGHVIGNA